MSAAVPQPPSRSLGARWLAGWWSVVLLCTDLVTATIGLLLLVTTVTAVATVVVLVGLPLLWFALWLGEVLATSERGRLQALSGRAIAPPPAWTSPVAWQRAIANPVRWRAVGYFSLMSGWGLIVGSAVVALIAQAALLVVLPLLPGAVPASGLQPFGLSWHFAGTSEWMVFGLAVVFLAALPLIAPSLAAVDVNLARWLIGRDPAQRELEHRVDVLTTSRADTVDSVESERRRIERDLHDGPQQRLVAIAMELGMARDALAKDPEAARELLDSAHQASKEAIAEIRQVARGIAPPILTDRGLDAAISALAARSPVSVRTSVELPGRLDPTVESIAYFCISESLTNVAKHSGATAAEVRAVVTDPPNRTLVVSVTDDGRGGASVGAGSGLLGLQQRLAAVDGVLDVDSPDGGPTVISMSIPLRTQGGIR